jgi:pyruvate kinase
MAKRDPVLDELLSRRGAVTKIAFACGISTAAVSQWRHVPRGHVETVAKALDMPAASVQAAVRVEAAA